MRRFSDATPSALAHLHRPRLVRALCVVIVCMNCAVFSDAASAQRDDYEITPDLERKTVNDMEVGGRIGEENFNAWIFGNAQPMNLKSEPPQLSVMLAELDRLCSITPEQKQKLELAAKMDMRMFLDDVEIARERFLKFKTQQEVFNEFYTNVIRPLAMRRTAGFLGRGSLFSKVIQTTLSPEQLKQFEAAQLERRKFQYRTAIDAALLSLSDASGFSAKQHESLAAYLLEHSTPPLVSGRQDRQYVYYQLSQLSNKQLQGSLSEDEIAKFKRLVAPYAGMKQSLISMGMLAPP